MRKLILILLLTIPLVCFSQSRFKKIKVGTDIWVIDSIFIRNDSLIFQINDTIQYGAPKLSLYDDLDPRFYYVANNNEAWIERRWRYFSN